MSLNRILQQQNGRGAGAKRRIVPGRFDHMSGHMVGGPRASFEAHFSIKTKLSGLPTTGCKS